MIKLNQWFMRLRSISQLRQYSERGFFMVWVILTAYGPMIRNIKPCAELAPADSPDAFEDWRV